MKTIVYLHICVSDECKCLASNAGYDCSFFIKKRIYFACEDRHTTDRKEIMIFI